MNADPTWPDLACVATWIGARARGRRGRCQRRYRRQLSYRIRVGAVQAIAMTTLLTASWMTLAAALRPISAPRLVVIGALATLLAAIGFAGAAALQPPRPAPAGPDRRPLQISGPLSARWAAQPRPPEHPAAIDAAGDPSPVAAAGPPPAAACVPTAAAGTSPRRHAPHRTT